MKAVKVFMSALALAAVSMMVAPSVSAREAENKDENGKTIRHPYLTNGFWDNTFVSAGLGINASYDNKSFNPVGFGLDIAVGKWVTPCVGLRASYNGIKSPYMLNGEKAKGNYFYGHGDLMWNISNAIGGYKESRLWDFVPYLHAGAMMIDKDKEFAAGFGLLNIIRLSKRVDLTLDIRPTLMKGAILKSSGYAGIVTAEAGVSVNLFRTDWTRACDYHNPEDVDKITAAEAAAAALTAANAALAAENSKLNEENDALKAENGKLADAVKEAEANTGITEVGPAAFYFEIGQTKLSEKELAHLDFYMSNVLPNVKGKNATIITGTADSKTGTAKRNQYLCKKRVEYLQKILVEKYGIEADSFKTATSIIPGSSALDRAAVISFE